VDAVIHGRIDELVDPIDLGAQLRRIIVRADVCERIERGIEHADDFGGFVVDDGALFLVPKNRHAGTAAIVRIGQHIDVGQHRFAVDGVERRAGLGAEFPAFLAEQRLGDRNRNHVVELLELAKNERAMRPLASMIADFANFSARLSRNLRPVVLTAISRSICRSDSVATCAACLSSASFFSSWRRSKLRSFAYTIFPIMNA
jgi:hypothetical protein